MSINARKLSHRFFQLVLAPSYSCSCHVQCANIWPAKSRKCKISLIQISDIINTLDFKISNRWQEKWWHLERSSCGMWASSPKSVALFSENTNELKTLKIGPWIKDRILLIDLGFYKYQVFTRIKENGGYFVSRLKSNANPLIIESYRTHRGRSIDVRGKQLQDVLKNLKRQVLDVEVEVTFNRRAYRGKEKKDSERFRLVAQVPSIYNQSLNGSAES